MIEPHGTGRPASPPLSIVIPVYREGDAVEPVLRRLAAEVQTPHEIVVVYDVDAVDVPRGGR